MPSGQDGSQRISLPESSSDAGSREETSRVQQLSSVAPPPAESETIDATNDVTTIMPLSEPRQPLRTVGWVMVIGGAIALTLVLIVPKLRSAPAAQIVSPPPALPVAPSVAEVQEAAPTKVEPALATGKGRRTKRAAAAAPVAESKETDIRIRARVAPVRAAPDADATVVCSVKRGAVMHSSQQAQGAKARWFAVRCDKDSTGWVHENFLTTMKP